MGASYICMQGFVLNIPEQLYHILNTFFLSNKESIDKMNKPWIVLIAAESSKPHLPV